MNDVKRINLDDYIQTGEGATALTYTSKDGRWAFPRPQRIEEANRRIHPFVATKVPFMLTIANRGDLILKTTQRLEKLLE